MTAAGATVIPFPRPPQPQACTRPVDALLELARRRIAWNRAHPHATDDEQIDALAAIAEELGL